MLIVVYAAELARLARNGIVVLETVRVVEVAVIKHHVHEPADEFRRLVAEKIIVESTCTDGQRLGDVAVRHWPDAAVPRAVATLAVPARQMVEERIILAARRHRIGRP